MSRIAGSFFLSFFLFAGVSCSSVGKVPESKDSAEMRNEPARGSVLPEKLSGLAPFIGTWHGQGKVSLRGFDNGPEPTITRVIEPGLSGKAVFIREEAGPGAALSSSLLITFLSSDTGEPQVSSYEAYFSKEFPEVTVASTPLNIEGRLIKWTIVKDARKAIQTIGRVETYKSHSRHTFVLRSPDELREVIETSEDGKQWYKIFEANLKRKN